MLIDRAWLAGGDAPDWAALRARLAALPRPVFPLEGRDVLALGEPEGPRVGTLLRQCGSGGWRVAVSPIAMPAAANWRAVSARSVTWASLPFLVTTTGAPV